LATAPVRNASGGVRDEEIDRGSVAQPKMQICFDRCLRQEVRRYARSARVQEGVVDDMHDRARHATVVVERDVVLNGTERVGPRNTIAMPFITPRLSAPSRLAGWVARLEPIPV
jgi:hypothetical protein